MSIESTENKQSLDRHVVPTISMRRAVIFPIPNFPIPITTLVKDLEAAAHARSGDGLVVITAQLDPEDELPTHRDLYQVGILAEVIDVRREDDSDIAVIEGISRAKIVQAREDSPILLAEVELLEDSEEESVELSALMQSLREVATQVVKLTPRLPDEVVEVFEHITDPSQLIDLIATQTSATVSQKQELLELSSVTERARAVMKLLSYERSLLEIVSEIRTEVR